MKNRENIFLMPFAVPSEFARRVATRRNEGTIVY